MIPTRRHLQYASGFIELGMFRDAARELRAIKRSDRNSAAVLTVRIDLHMYAKQWKQVIAVSRALTQAEPGDDKGWVSWAFALRELELIPEARAVLLAALPLHGKKCALLHYNLACYECLLGNLPEARRRLAAATRKDKHWKTEAIDDPDLKGLWPEISLMKE